METCGEKISASTGSGKKIAGLLKKKLIRMKIMTRNACKRILECQTHTVIPSSPSPAAQTSVILHAIMRSWLGVATEQDASWMALR